MDNDFLTQELGTDGNTEEITEQTEQTELEKIKLGDREFTQDELLQKVGLADQVSELEGKYNTKLDRVWPEYGRSQNELKEARSKLAEYEQQKQSGAPVDPTQAQEAIKAARSLGILTKEDGVVTKAEFRQLLQEERETEKLLDTVRGYEKDIDGKDGRPKFSAVEVLEHMRDTGIKDPMRAYKDRYETQLDSWKQSEIGRAKSKGMYTTTGSQGNKQPVDIKPTTANLHELVSEALQGNV